MTTQANRQRPVKGLALLGLIVGLSVGLAVYAITEYWIDKVESQQLPVTVLFFVCSSTLAFLLLAESGRFVRAGVSALVIAAIIAIPNYFMAAFVDNQDLFLTEFPVIFWFSLAGPIAVFLMVTLARASLEDGAPPPYSAVFFHGLTLPLIVGGATLFAILALVLLFAWAALLKSMDVQFFHELFQEPWFILPFLGAIGGLSVTLMRGLEPVLGALRFILLLFCRIAMPITAIFSITFLVVLGMNGTDAIFDKPYPGAMMLGLAFAGMLIFNGVYQNGEGKPPAWWMRIPTIITLIGFPVYAVIAAWAFWLRVGEYGLTPPRIAGLTITGLTVTYSLVCLAGLVSEINWRGARWMPLMAPFNTAMAVVWIVILVLMATPVMDPWALSAQSQYTRLAKGKTDAAKFDYGYLRFELGTSGEEALDKLLSLENHPQAVEIKDGVERARAAPNYWTYKDEGDEAPTPAPLEEDTEGPMSLELNPDDDSANTGEVPPDQAAADDENTTSPTP